MWQIMSLTLSTVSKCMSVLLFLAQQTPTHPGSCHSPALGYLLKSVDIATDFHFMSKYICTDLPWCWTSNFLLATIESYTEKDSNFGSPDVDCFVYRWKQLSISISVGKQFVLQKTTWRLFKSNLRSIWELNWMSTFTQNWYLPFDYHHQTL